MVSCSGREKLAARNQEQTAEADRIRKGQEEGARVKVWGARRDR